MNAVLKYASLVKFAHTVFAMPFAMVGFVYGLRYAPLHNPRWPYIVLVQVILCMVFARNAAMGFNRWADRRIDAENPRTAGREIPAGKIPARHALWFVAVNALLFVATAATINRLAAILSPVALSVILVYSYCKRFTPLAHLVLGLSLGIAPVGAFIAAAGHVVFDGHVVVEPFILALLVTTWCGGFDIIYALQDAEFDRRHGLHSIPACFSARSALVSTSTVLLPARALIAPMPLPIMPLPTTITISLILTFSSRCVQSSGSSSTTRPFVLPSRSSPNASLICSNGTVL